MRLYKIRIQNFRCIRDLECDLSDYTTLIGANNAGKSSVLKAIEIFLNQGKFFDEDWSDRNFENSIMIEGIFDDIQAWERAVPGVAGIIQNNEIKLRVICSYDNDKGKPGSPVYEAFFEPEEINGWNEKWSDLENSLQNVINAQFPTANGTWWRTKGNRELVKSFLRENHNELITRGVGQWSREGISIDAALKQAIPQAVLIPASSDFNSDIKTTSKTPFGQLIESIVMPAVRMTPEFQGFETAVRNLISKIRGEDTGNNVPELIELTRGLTERLSSIIMNTEVILTMTPPEIHKIIGGGASIKIRDGIETSLEYQGHGTQRALIFALIETIAKKNSLHPVGEDQQQEERRRPTIILFEEPELYLHPHLMRRLKKALTAISTTAQWQVLSSTHSPFLIDVATEPKSLIILKRSEGRGNVIKSQILSDIYQTEIFSGEREMLRALLDFSPSVCEAFFAENVILVEGDTEVSVFSLAKEYLSAEGRESPLLESTTIVSCDGKWTIPAIAKVLIRLGVNVKVVHDKDAKGKSEEVLATLTGFHEYCANRKILEVIGNPDRIFLVDDTFEHVLWPVDEAPEKDKPFNGWRKVRDIINNEEIDHYEQLKRIFLFAYP